MKEKVQGKKTCSRCGDQKPLSMFYKSESIKDGLEGTCKVCRCKSREFKSEKT